jgi:predicted transcriptional regulator
MPTSPPTVTPLPTPVPQTSDPENFDTRADEFLGALPNWEDDLDALGENVYANAVEAHEDAVDAAASALAAAASETVSVGNTDYMATSTSSLTMAAGTKTVALAQAGKAFVATDQVVLVYRPDPEVRLIGTVDSVVGQTLTVTVSAEGVVGSGGPYANWLVVLQAFYVDGATAAELLAAASAYVAITPKALKDAQAAYALTDAATVTPDGLLGRNFTWTIGGNRTLGAIQNTYPNARGTITITQDATGSRVLAVNSAWKRQGGLGVLSIAAGAVDELLYEVKAVDGSGNATRIVYELIKAPR